MSNNDQWDFSNEDDQSQNNSQQNQGNGLRAQLERALSELKTLKEANATLTRQVRETTISSMLEKKNLNPKIAKLIPSEVEPTKEALDKWFEENEDLFPASPKEGQGESEGQQSEADLEDPEQAEIAADMDRLGNVANSGRVPQRQTDLAAQLTSKDLTPEKLLELIHAAGGGVGSG